MALSRVADVSSHAASCGGMGVVPRLHHPGVRLRIAVPCAAAAAAGVQEQYTTFEVVPEEAIKDLKLHMLNRGFTRPPGAGSSCLVFGELDERARADLVTASSAGGGDWLHIFAPAAAVESVSVRTLLQEFSLSGGGGGGGGGAPCGAPAAAASPAADPLPLVPAAAAAAATPPAMVHVLVHKSARVAWRRMGDGLFELSISSPPGAPPCDDTRHLMRKVEDATGVSLRDGQHKLVYGTQVLDAGRPLASYGIQKGALLKLLPVEPPACCNGPDGGAGGREDTLPDGSPRLASPLHELHRHWRRAAAGLLEGHAPRLAPAGTGLALAASLSIARGDLNTLFYPIEDQPKHQRGCSSLL
ncbi:hypothetical protein MNEG_7416 [Monoraphidium neglectum]|uniref:Ubiquitin-like domain-containing protein n=1 Tax=Monoraphidium neglectum TaxID=145388 RepID=A0A0D2MIS0_9CHLO|nr:hypothetical protein MNEG_7416 [Monoraphidium neglectum]KIZ00542.1 hypothetical protein MNEG_7416 [Monoraphidium neglectum]|eukprot:XP_013899561.1 hypothetical protein MNEG_7416 [Monoraphidium neglectum]